MSLAGPGGAERIFSTFVTGNYFTALGVRPAAGRLFGAGDSEQPGDSPIAVLSHGFWMRRFNGDPSVVGRTLQLIGTPVYRRWRGARRLPGHEPGRRGSVAAGLDAVDRPRGRAVDVSRGRPFEAGRLGAAGRGGSGRDRQRASRARRPGAPSRAYVNVRSAGFGRSRHRRFRRCSASRSAGFSRS